MNNFEVWLKQVIIVTLCFNLLVLHIDLEIFKRITIINTNKSITQMEISKFFNILSNDLQHVSTI